MAYFISLAQFELNKNVKKKKKSNQKPLLQLEKEGKAGFHGYFVNHL